jgi:sugar lactone lactonase YvrE/lysophospholipase L1-like esterase
MKLKALGINLLVALGSLVFLFAVLEIGARLFLPRPETVLVDDVKKEANEVKADKELRVRSGLGGYVLFRETDAGLRLNKNIRMIIRSHQLSGKNVEIRTNNLGYRGDDILDKTDKEFRILVLGDSITLADYAPEDGTYPAYLERRLKLLGPAANGVRVINSGTSSIDLRSEFMILMETGLSTKPDIIVEGLYLNDADVSFTLNAVTYPPSIRWSRLLTFLMSRTNYLRTALQVRARQEDRKTEQKDFEARNPVTKDGDWHESDGAFNREIVDAFGDWGYAWTDDAWRKMEETLTLMKQVAADHDAELYVVLLPVRQQVEAKKLRDEPQRQFERVAQKLGLRYLNLLPTLREKFAADHTDFYYDHCHMRPEGNELVGRLIAEKVAKESGKLHALGVTWNTNGDVPGALTPTTKAERPPELLNRPQGVAVNPQDGGLLVADENENAIVRVSPQGRFEGRFGKTVLKQPNNMAFDGKGGVYIADTWNQRVAHLAADGSSIEDLRPPTDGGFYAPRDVAVAPEGDVFVANTGRARIERYDGRGNMTHWGEAGDGKSQFHEPLGLAIASREVYVVDYGNARIQVFTYEGRLVRSFTVKPWIKASMGFRPGIAIYRDRLYLSDGPNSAILIYSLKGEEVGQIHAPEIIEPSGLAVAKSGTLYITNLGTGMVAAVNLNATGQLAVAPFAPK